MTGTEQAQYLATGIRSSAPPRPRSGQAAPAKAAVAAAAAAELAAARESVLVLVDRREAALQALRSLLPVPFTSAQCECASRCLLEPPGAIDALRRRFALLLHVISSIGAALAPSSWCAHRLPQNPFFAAAALAASNLSSITFNTQLQRPKSDQERSKRCQERPPSCQQRLQTVEK